ncbi:MAG: HDOD domain-containing protein [Agarilytica sp.]
MTESILLASQGIYNCDKELFGTELLFRNENGNTAMEIGEDLATSAVLVNLCSSITHEVEHLQRPAFVNVNTDFLLSEAFLPVEPASVFIELVERAEINDRFIDSVKAWKNKGFRFALDDFEFTEEWGPLLELADVVKVDVLGVDPRVIEARINSLKNFPCKCLAERVETEDEFNLFKSFGFDYFQGYFLARPKIIKGKNIRPEHASAIEIMRVTASQDASFDEVASTVANDPRLSIQILKMVNSPLYNLERPISTIREAIVFLGIGQLRKWAVMLTLLSASDNSREAHRIVLNRAKFCEMYASQIGGVDPDNAFLTGIISGIDILLGVEVDYFAKSVNLSQEVIDAVVDYQGRLGKILKLAKNLERVLSSQPDRLANNKQSVLDVFHNSFHWTEEIVKGFDDR